MKIIILVLVGMLLACCGDVKNIETENNADSNENVIDSNQVKGRQPTNNTRFRNVTVAKTGANIYTIEGEGQIFEASFGWVVEDGHNELKSGFEMTDAGAPEWGRFKFTIEVEKQQPNSTLTLILFETSAKDGSRQYELPIVLE
jgi:hypothetical protein